MLTVSGHSLRKCITIYLENKPLHLSFVDIKWAFICRIVGQTPRKKLSKSSMTVRFIPHSKYQSMMYIEYNNTGIQKRAL